jgi:hypothetical protein
VLRFLLGFVLALAAVAGAAYFYIGKDALKDPCFGRCGDATRCASSHCTPSFAEKPVVPEAKKGHRGKRTALTKDGITSAEPEKKLLPGDDKLSTTGDALGRPEHIDLTEGGDDGKELQQSEIDRVWSSAEPQLSHCITDALGDWPLDSGKLEVSYRIEKDGSVKKMRLQAPQLLLRNGLYACMKPKVTGLRFPKSGGSSVVTFPFQIQ